MTSNDDHGNPASPSLVFSTRALEMPLRSWRVVKSGASDGGFWFHSQCSSVSSVREGQFMMGGRFDLGGMGNGEWVEEVRRSKKGAPEVRW